MFVESFAWQRSSHNAPQSDSVQTISSEICMQKAEGKEKIYKILCDKMYQILEKHKKRIFG